MKRLFGNVALVLCSSLVSLTLANAEELKEARVTQVVKDVKLLPQQAAPRPATVRDLIREGTAVRTGAQSRSELTFNDLTITRLGANTIFSFEEGTRMMDLRDGAILFQVPKGSGGATIRTAAVTAAITGTTGIGEFHPAGAGRSRPFSKWLCLEGRFYLILPNGQKVELGPGKMVTTDGENFSQVMDFDIGQVMNTSLLVNGYDTPLASLPLIQLEQERQLAPPITRTPITNTRLLDPANIIKVVDQGIAAQESPTVTPTPSSTPSTPTPTPSTPTPTPSTPTPTPGKFGALTVIASSDPYVITGGTTIQTDPTITTNGQTDFGKIYRGSAQDGPLSEFIFGSTSAFDTASGFDAYFATKAPIAAFKFQSLQLIGNPIIDTTDGPTNLALIGVSGIISGPPGGTLTFSGIDTLLLATQSGSINLSADLTFSGLALYVYARGANSVLTFDSSVSDTTDLYLHSEGNLEITDALAAIQQSDGQTSGLNISLRAGETINAGGNLTLRTDASDIANGGNIWVMSGGDMTIGGAFTLFAAAAPNSTTGTGGNITVNSGGSLTAGSLNFDLFFDDSNGVTNGENLSLNVAGNLTTNAAGGVDLELSTPVGAPLINGGNLSLMVGGNVNIGAGGPLNMTLINTVDTMVSDGANLSASIGGNLSAATINATIDNSQNGGIGTGGNLTLDIGGNVNGGVFTLLLDNSDSGQIGTGGNISVTTGEDLTADSIGALINNRDGGSIESGGNITFNIGDALITDGEVSLIISGRDDGGGGGTIGSSSAINLNAASAAVGGDLVVGMGISFSEEGGLSSALSTINIAGDLTIGGGLDFSTQSGGANLNQELVGGATIDNDALLSLTAANVSTGPFLNALIVNFNGGEIGQNAAITFNVSGDIDAQGDARFQIVNTIIDSTLISIIGSDASIALSAGSLSTGGVLFTQITNEGGGAIDGDASIAFDVVNGIDSAGAATFRIVNFDDGTGNGGGTIGGDATIGVAAPTFSAASLIARINNSGGSIGGNAAINMNVSGSAAVTGDATLEILGSDEASPAAINMNGGSYDIGGTLRSFIDGNGTITFNNASVAADVLKVGALGTDGVLNIGGGTLSADTELKLYAPGSNGELNFVSDVTLGGNSAKILAANSVTIMDDVVVTIGGTNPADVYTNNANYSEEFGGNDSTTGTFAGAGANQPQPLPSAPPFDDAFRPVAASSPSTTTSHPRTPSKTPRTRSRPPSTPHVTSKNKPRGDLNIGGRKPTGAAIKVSDSGQLLSLLEGAPDTGGKITVAASTDTPNKGNSGRGNGTARLNANRGIMNAATGPPSQGKRLR